MFRYIFVGIAAVSACWAISSDASARDDTYVRLLPEQAAALKSAYPEYGMFRACSGHFGGLNDHDVVLGLQFMLSVRRVGIIWDGSKWTIHDIDAELKQDSGISRSLPIRWSSNISGDPKEDFRCDFKQGKDARIGVEGDKPFFDLKEAGLEKSTAVCFATHKTYNNWDCTVYSPKDKRFKLWFQQADAD